MLHPGPATKVTIHLNEDTGATDGFLTETVLAYLMQNGVHGATLLRADAGFGIRSQLHKRGAGDVEGLHTPVVIYFIETQEKVDSIIGDLLDMVTDGLVEAHPTTILKHASAAERVIS
ncbi:MAG TPA: DUF190 domain-containing protein [Edaphobacter sp.]